MKVSIIIYVLNSVQYIERCIRSVMDQTLQEIEILIIDGGSKDGTIEVIEKLMHIDMRIHLIHSTAGVGHQFNIGLKNAKGEYVGICEADDYILPNMYEEQYKIAKKNHLDILRADFMQFCEVNGEEYQFPNILLKERTMYNKVLPLSDKEKILRMGVNGFWSGIYRREFLLQNEIYMNETEGASYQDTSFAFLTVIKAERIMFSNRAFYCYRKDNPDSSIYNPKKINTLLYEYTLLKKRLEKYSLFETYKEIYWSWKLDGCLWIYHRLSDKLKKIYIDVLYKDIHMDLMRETYQGYELSKKAKNMLIYIRKSKEYLWNYMEFDVSITNKLKENLNEIFNHKEIVIFGCGEIGKLIYLYLKLLNIKPEVFIDNNKDKWEKTVGNILVKKPENIAKLYADACYIVANETHDKEMKEQLIHLAIPEKNIIVCNNYMMFLDEVLIKQLLEKKADNK